MLDWRIPLTSGEELPIRLEVNSPVFVVGPNGSGKSALIQHAVTSLGAENVRRISAHRQTWLQSAAISLTPQSRRQFEQNLKANDANPEFRWREWSSEQQVSSVLFDLTAKENDLARRIMDKSYAKAQEAVEKIISDERPPFDQVNDLLHMGGFAVTVSNSKGEEILAQHRDFSNSYSMAQMSDGERNAVILAANVLTVDSGTVLLIDEPERHLHRSIIEPYLSALIAQRKDCYFIISTHEIALPLCNPEASVLIVRSCAWNGATPTGWEARLLQGDTKLPEDIRRAILGARKRVLFVEGKPESLDFQLYSALFTGISIVPVGSCDNVVKAVIGLRNSHEHHDVESFGLVDGDNRNRDEIEDLEGEIIYALNQYSVESIYYCSDSMNAVAKRQAESLGVAADEMVKAAKDAAIASLSRGGVDERMAARLCERDVREKIRSQLPDWKAIMNGSNVSIQIDTDGLFKDELAYLRSLLNKEDMEQIISRYPVRESDALGEITKQFSLSKANYEKTLLSRIRNDGELAEQLRKRVGSLSTALA